MEKFDPSFYSSEDYELIARTDFEIYDKDKSGFIELSEIKEILTEQSKRIEEMGVNITNYFYITNRFNLIYFNYKSNNYTLPFISFFVY